MIVLLQKIQEQKRLAIHNRDRNGWIMICSIVMGFAFAAVWISCNPEVNPGAIIMKSLFSAILLGIAIPIIAFRRQRSKCPGCGLNWDMLAYKRTIEETWPACPVCGLNLKI